MKFARLRFGGLCLAALTVLALPAVAPADVWPAEPVKIVAAFAPGGAADLYARVVAAEALNRVIAGRVAMWAALARDIGLKVQ
jgi:tripartite-type tricarboxylate transporter receptor subunit TctC